MDTVRAVIVARFHVMSDYARQVLWPVLRKDCQDGECRRGLRRMRKLLVRDLDTMDARSRSLLEGVLQRFADLRIAYQYRERLQQIWSRSAASHDVLLKALQDWCQQAEATGVCALQEFALRLKGYSLQAA